LLNISTGFLSSVLYGKKVAQLKVLFCIKKVGTFLYVTRKWKHQTKQSQGACNVTTSR